MIPLENPSPGSHLLSCCLKSNKLGHSFIWHHLCQVWAGCEVSQQEMNPSSQDSLEEQNRDLCLPETLSGAWDKARDVHVRVSACSGRGDSPLCLQSQKLLELVGSLLYVNSQESSLQIVSVSIFLIRSSSVCLFVIPNIVKP